MSLSVRTNYTGPSQLLIVRILSTHLHMCLRIESQPARATTRHVIRRGSQMVVKERAERETGV